MSRPVSLILIVVAALAAMAPGSAWAHGPRRPRVVQVSPIAVTTDRVVAAVDRDLRERGQLVTERDQLAARYERELREIDRLKRQKASWRRDRELRPAMSASLETARKLQAVTAGLAAVDARLARDRRALISAVDAELATAVPAERHSRLVAARRSASAALDGGVARKIVVPDAALDPLADPEELDQQAAALRESEAELAREMDLLARRALRFQRMDELRRQHERAGELAVRDDSGPRRNRTSSGRPVNGDSAPPLGLPPPPSSDSPPSTDTPPKSELPDPVGYDPALVLSEVVDAATVDALRRAERSADPAARAVAAERARQQVSDRLRRLRDQRAAIERRARELRGP